MVCSVKREREDFKGLNFKLCRLVSKLTIMTSLRGGTGQNRVIVYLLLHIFTWYLGVE